MRTFSHMRNEFDTMTPAEFTHYVREWLCRCDLATLIAELGSAIRVDNVNVDDVILMRARARQLREALDAYEDKIEDMLAEKEAQ